MAGRDKFAERQRLPSVAPRTECGQRMAVLVQAGEGAQVDHEATVAPRPARVVPCQTQEPRRSGVPECYEKSLLRRLASSPEEAEPSEAREQEPGRGGEGNGRGHALDDIDGIVGPSSYRLTCRVDCLDSKKCRIS